MAYIRNVLIVETPVFTRRIMKLMSDDSYRALQSYLVMDPETGKLIQGSGGLRKLRWSAPGRGKRGGITNHLLLDHIKEYDSYADGICQE